MKKNLSIITLAALTIWLLGSCAKDSVAAVADTPEAEFTVNAKGKKVQFSKGNLYADSNNALHFESNQYSSANSWDASHVSHFTWSSTVAAAVGDSNSGDNLFCDENHKVSVDGSNEIYYALSKDEWGYLFVTHTHKWVTVNNVNGYVIAPDIFFGKLADTYADDAELAKDNLVFLPAAGFRYMFNIQDGNYGYYWSSTAYGSNDAYYLCFNSDNVTHDDKGPRGGYSIRLVKDVK